MLIVVLAAVASAERAAAFCGCDKPPPPRASVRPFAAYPDQTVTLFDDRLKSGRIYTVLFESRDGTRDWSRGKAQKKRDQADGASRRQLRVAVGSVALGPCRISVFDDANAFVYAVADDQFTVIAPPIALRDVAETITRDDFRAAVGADGTIYLAFDTTAMTNATTYSGVAEGYGLRFDDRSVAFFNSQGFLGGFLDPSSPGLFRLSPGDSSQSTALDYWRHEFKTYKEEHRHRDARRSDDNEWHGDGTPHVDNYHLIVAISGTLADGSRPEPGATPPFRLILTSTPAPSSNL